MKIPSRKDLINFRTDLMNFELGTTKPKTYFTPAMRFYLHFFHFEKTAVMVIDKKHETKPQKWLLN